MENGKHIKIRMCVACRKRDRQDNLYRLQCKNGELVSFSGRGRSFYVCRECINSKKFINYISKLCNLTKNEAKEKLFHFPFYIKEKEFI
ncbi:conserved hypothetical protein [Lebetimonas natsushimae]|uniref:YlxR domain-containing protein n=1 Tax=Lebetimonas natsushimae TaxID=1936991 RepID=A0A292YAL7_9BACT|nr:DUF448 domain-containing protein [Lebetimonas natsushimae]GAX87107.1 conserved hypothetical protein [Lebetimonas natsushimae]